MKPGDLTVRVMSSVVLHTITHTNGPSLLSFKSCSRAYTAGRNLQCSRSTLEALQVESIKFRDNNTVVKSHLKMFSEIRVQRNAELSFALYPVGKVSQRQQIQSQP